LASSASDTSHLFQPDTFTKNDRYSGVFLYNNSTLAFTFNGNDIVDSGGHTICNPVYTNAQGKASCIIEFFRNPDPNDPTPVPFSSLPSCGYVRVKAPEKFIGSTLYQSGSATITVCPKNNLAISAFGPAIISAFDPGSPQGLQNLAICFPSLLIAGILMASMYYSGRDPLSLFDITTPRLPKGQTFKIKAGATPQMLRQVLRRYAMLKKQAKADTEKLFVKLVKMSSEYQNASLTGKIGLAMAAKRQARAFYNDLEKATRLTKATGGIQTLQLNDKKRQLGEMMRNVSGLDKDSWDRKKKTAVGHHDQYGVPQLQHLYHGRERTAHHGRGTRPHWQGQPLLKAGQQVHGEGGRRCGVPGRHSRDEVPGQSPAGPQGGCHPGQGGGCLARLDSRKTGDKIGGPRA
jgi:hypothetical protein